MTLDKLVNHQALQQHRTRLKGVHMRELFKSDPVRFDHFSLQAPEIFLDYSKNCIDQPLLKSLVQLAEEAELETAISAMFGGEEINNTENRAVLHTALRSQETSPLVVDGVDIRKEIVAARQKVYDFVSKIHDGTLKGFTGKPIKSLVSIGIGGSYLGPVLANEALSPYKLDGFNAYFVANIDSSDLHDTLSIVDPETTLFLIQSKSFGTQETRENALAARDWLLRKGAKQSDIALHFAAVSSNVDAAVKFGIKNDRVFPMWDWVGGRYSLWSAIGLPIIFQLGQQCFDALLQGAYEMDTHFRSAPFNENMPVVMALIGIWNNNYLGTETQAVIPYSQHLSQLPSYLQQLDMESNGKRVSYTGETLSEGTGPVIWAVLVVTGNTLITSCSIKGRRSFRLILLSHDAVSIMLANIISTCSRTVWLNPKH